MLGGGNFTSQDKALPGSYINFVSASKASPAMSGRGIAAVPLALDWGPARQVFTVDGGQFQKDCQKLFGYSYEAEEMRDLRELFLNITEGIFYRLNAGAAAANDFAAARYGGTRGNKLSVAIAKDVDDESRFNVRTYLDGREVDSQTVAEAGQLADNDYIIFKKDATLAVTAGTPLTGGSDGDGITGADHSDFLAAVESRTFHALCCPSMDDAVKMLYVAYTKRLRDEAGVKFQTVVYRKEDADYEGIISVDNECLEKEAGLVYWVAGAAAACAVNKTNENRAYNGEYTVKADYTQAQLSEGIRSGKYMFHKAGDSVRVLMDINTLVSHTPEKSADFSSNQTIRVLDQVGNDIAALFNSAYLGKVPNDGSGRISFWSDIVAYGKQLAAMRAVEPINADDIVVEKGQTKRSVAVSFPLEPVNCMSQLYMTVIVQ